MILLHFAFLFFILTLDNLTTSFSFHMKSIKIRAPLKQFGIRRLAVIPPSISSRSLYEFTPSFSDEDLKITRRKINSNDLNKQIEKQGSKRVKKIVSESLELTLPKSFIKDDNEEISSEISQFSDLESSKLSSNNIESEVILSESLPVSTDISLDSSGDNEEASGESSKVKKGDNEINYILFFDGGSRSNTCSGCGISLYKNKVEKENEIWSASLYFSSSITSNTAEYFSIVYALKELSQYKIKNLTVYGDSRLVIKQINKEWNINYSHLKILNDSIQSMLSLDCQYDFIWIPREKNTRADELANLAMDNKRSSKSCELSTILPFKSPSIKNKIFLKSCEDSWKMALQIASFSPLVRN